MRKRTPRSRAGQGARSFGSVCVVGGGAIGSLVAAHLARLVPVTVLVRRPEHAAALAAHGLRVSGKAELTAQVAATASGAEVPPFDLAVFATKSTDLEPAAAALAGRSPGATVMTIQNGLGAEEIVGAHGDWLVVGATTLMGGRRLSDTHVEYELAAPTWLAPYAGTSTPFAVARAVERLFVQAGLLAQAFRDLRPVQWSKLVFNAAVGTVAALTGLPHSPPFADESGPGSLGRLVRGVIDEGRAVAAAQGIALHEDPWELNVRAVSATGPDGSPYAHPPSILLDVLARRPTELEFNAGALVRAAERAGVAVPLTSALYALLRGRERSWSVEARSSRS